jgi:hypothetical protein
MVWCMQAFQAAEKVTGATAVLEELNGGAKAQSALDKIETVTAAMAYDGDQKYRVSFDLGDALPGPAYDAVNYGIIEGMRGLVPFLEFDVSAALRMAWCGLLCCVAVCCAALRCPVLCCAVLRCAVLRCAVLRCAALRCVVLSCAVLCRVVPCRIVLCHAAL